MTQQAADDFVLQINPGVVSQGTIRFGSQSLPAADAPAWLGAQMGFRPNIDKLVPAENPGHGLPGLVVEKLQQYYKGIPLEHGIVSITSKAGVSNFMQAEFYTVPDDFNTSPVLSGDQALGKALDRIAAKKYVWEGYTGTDSNFIKPQGQLVIVEDRKQAGNMLLCYKFLIYAAQPMSRDYVYVNAWDGSIVLIDRLIKHQNATGQADTRYSGHQQIFTTKTGQHRYELAMTTDYGVTIETKNFQRRDAADFASTGLAKPFIDEDNNWRASEFNNSQWDDAALDAHFNMKVILDFWQRPSVLNRKSFDGKGSKVESYVHVRKSGPHSTADQNMENAFWNGSAMYYGDGDFLANGTGRKPYTSLDICAHEFAHAICQATSKLVYERESGALNEGFSDIWAACVENYYNTTIGGSQKDVWLMANEISADGNTNMRDMANPNNSNNTNLLSPTLKGQPAIYKQENYWKDASYEGCPVADELSDQCGVHTNSGVLNKWFYQLVVGGNTQLSFDDAARIVYLTEQNLTPNSGYLTTKAVSIIAAATLFPEDGWKTDAVKAAWNAVGVIGDNFFNMENTPVFTTNAFTAIGVGKDGHVWAGTSRQGLYKYNGSVWEKSELLYNHLINGIVPDKNGGIWIAQAGHTGAQAIAGGLNYFSNSSFASNQFFSKSAGLASRNCYSVYVDTLFGGPLPRVWTANLSQVNNVSGLSEKGGLSIGPMDGPTAFASFSDALSADNSTTNGFQTVSGNGKTILAYAIIENASLINKRWLLEYDAKTLEPVGAYSSNNVPELDADFVARAIHIDDRGNKWIGLTTGGLVVQDRTGIWHRIRFETLVDELSPGVPFPTTTRVNNNAITSDAKGNVYIGTTNGLFLYVGFDKYGKDDFKWFSKAKGLPSNNITGIAIEYKQNIRPLIATDNGIIFYDPICNSCASYTVLPNFTSTIADGDWGDPAIWSNGKVPDANTEVTVKNEIVVAEDAECATLTVVTPGLVRVSAGKKLDVLRQEPPIIHTGKSGKP